MIRPTEIRDGGGNQYATRERGFDKHWGKAICYITVERNLYWWTRMTVNTSIVLRENTDACAPTKQYQVIREEAITIELESLIPNASNDTAKQYLYDLRAGKIVTKLYTAFTSPNTESMFKPIFQETAVPPTGTIGNDSAYGAFVIESSSVEMTRDDFSNLSITIRALGYGDTTQIVDAGTSYDDEAGFSSGGSASSGS